MKSSNRSSRAEKTNEIREKGKKVRRSRAIFWIIGRNGGICVLKTGKKCDKFECVSL